MTDRLRKGLDVASGLAFGVIAGLRKSPVALVDIGGRGGLTRAWHAFWRAGLVVPIFFEPDRAAALELRSRYAAPAKIIEKAAWSEMGERTLFVTTAPPCSSILQPKPDARMPTYMQGMLKVDRQVAVQLVRADSALETLGVAPEIVKIDVQGGELEVLKGFGESLRSVLCCELEVSFMRAYDSQPLFEEVYNYMIDMGFGLFDLQAFGVAGGRTALQANAFFCRRELTSRRQTTVEHVFRHANAFEVHP